MAEPGYVLTDRTLVLVDKFCNAGEIEAHSVQLGENGPHISLITLCLAFVYIFMGFVIIYFIKIQERNARLGDSAATKSVIFPVFVTCLWINSFINMYIGVVFIADVWMDDAVLPATLFAIAFGSQHFIVEGVTVLLMKKGMGWDGAKSILPYVACWGLFTAFCKFVSFYGSFTKSDDDLAWITPWSHLFNYIWNGILLVFYGSVWFVPQKNLFRRPAAMNYAAFWFCIRAFSLLCSILNTILDKADATVVYCAIEISPFFLIAAFEPFIVYYTLLQDSRWWQGLDIFQGRRRRDAEALRSPLEGIDIALGAAQALANTLDFMQEGEVMLRNFAYISLDKKKQLGSGSFSKVYKGSYKGQTCAIKLIFTVDLTADVIRRVAAEAQILSRICHVNIVKTFGVSVLPPSVCILLEYCKMGSLQDVVKGSGIFFSTSGRIGTQELFSPYVQLIRPQTYLGVASRGSPWLDGTGSPFPSEAHGSTRHYTSKTGNMQKVREDEPDTVVNISTADRLWLAIGCASGMGALHDFNNNLCHRDVKSFNFLVDEQLCVKLADMELGVSDELAEKGTISSTRKCSNASSVEIGECNVENNVDTPLDDEEKSQNISLASVSSGMAKMAADASGNALDADEFLANWAAPEVIRGNPHTQSSDIYSTALVLWELLSGRVPFSGFDSEQTVAPRQDEVRRRILLGERPELPMVNGDGKSSAVDNEDGDDDVEKMKPYYDGYGRGSLSLRESRLNRIPVAPEEEHIISYDSPYAEFIRLIRRGWTDIPKDRYSAAVLHKELHMSWRSLCHKLCMFVCYDPDNNITTLDSVPGSSDDNFDAQPRSDAKPGLSSYHTPYARPAMPALKRGASFVGSTLSALQRAPKDKAFPPLTRGSSMVEAKSRTGSITSTVHGDELRSTGTGTGLESLPDNSRACNNATHVIYDADEENFRSILASVASDSSYNAFDADGGAWVIVSSNPPHFILRTTQSFCNLIGLGKECVGKPIEGEICGPETDRRCFRQFLYESTLFSMYSESTMRRQEAARCTTSIYPSRFCNHAMLRVYKSNPFDRSGFTAMGDDSFESINLDSPTPKRSQSTPQSSSTMNALFGLGSNDEDATGAALPPMTGTARANQESNTISIHAFPLFAASCGNGDRPPGAATGKNADITPDMQPVAFSLLFSEFHAKLAPKKGPCESGGLSGMMSHLMQMGRNPVAEDPSLTSHKRILKKHNSGGVLPGV